jgi:hypothetical protein
MGGSVYSGGAAKANTGYTLNNSSTCYNGCGKEGGDVVYSSDIKKNECDDCYSKRSERNLANCMCEENTICQPCRDDGVVCNNAM